MAIQPDTTGSQQSPISEEKQCRRALPPGPDDLVILARDNEFYWLKKSNYEGGTLVPESVLGQMKHLVEHGVVLADVPVGSIPGVGIQCYLLNLQGIRRPAARPTSTPPPPGRPASGPQALDENHPCLKEPAPAIDDLVILDRMGERYYWVKVCEYQRDDCRLGRYDPILAEQVRLLTNQGVVLADVPGGIIPGVDDMGLLVNLLGIQRPRVKEEQAQQGSPTAAAGCEQYKP